MSIHSFLYLCILPIYSLLIIFDDIHVILFYLFFKNLCENYVFIYCVYLSYLCILFVPGNRKLAYFLRDNEVELQPYRFLFSIYRPGVYYFEVVDM